VETPGVADQDAVQRAVAKIEAAVGQAQPAGVAVGLALREAPETSRVRDTVSDGVLRKRALHLRYYTPSRDEITERVVDPMRMLLVEGRGYLEAWCRAADGVRLFRLDRIDAVDVLDEPAAPPPHATPTDTSEGLFQPDPSQRTAVLVLEPDARWVAEYYPTDGLVELPEGRARVLMRYADTAWMVRLLLGLGGEAHVEQPPDLVAEVARQAEAALRRADHLPAT
jgi:proteasome accessory factor C